MGVDIAAAEHVTVEADVTDEERVRDMYVRTREEHGAIQVLFNNAGISPQDDASVLDTSLEACSSASRT